ncbi:MAG: phosphoribosylaminoimidazolesuccinocarboxamide synthase [Flavobacteriales bacterium]|nr:phosphoribosylaminoimidazolesuccinocarboxamide synthase [Flavobacteriales bacterium]MCB9168278.1 phosphoribosylaminoimidazolesuccinocarboxamide synthase [Flavobacteriales bacterium]
MPNTLTHTALRLPEGTTVHHGKVRDVYRLSDGRLILVATDRISAFDVILPRGIPHKGQVLTQLSWHMLQATADVAPNWADAMPDPQVIIGRACEPVKVEMVVRGYLSGHAWRSYRSGQRVLCGAPMPDGMRESDAFPAPIITPSTKADEGHDEDITPAEVLERGLCKRTEWDTMANYALALYARGQEIARSRGLILVDTKYEFGRDADGRILLIDEIHTPDSSRYFHLEGYAERQARGERQKQLSKEFVREWLIAHDFMGKEGQQVPAMDDAFVQSVSDRYIELYETITGQAFQPTDTTDIEGRVQKAVSDHLT